MEGAWCTITDGIAGAVRPVAPVLLLVLIAAGGPARAQDSPHGKLAFACEECHSPDSWKEMPNPAKFDHARTGFVLQGQHADVACMDCHTALTFKFKKSATRCADCHQDMHNAELGATCDRCHSVTSWLVPDMVQKHSSTRFALVGMHATVPCQECHVNEQKHEYVGLRTDCYGCHQRDYDGTTAPSHRASGLGTDCQSCHAVNAMTWQGVSFAGGGAFDHARTGFPLAGAHASVACTQCHTSGRFGVLPTQCYNCHQQDFTTANSPPHAGFSTDCTSCHTNTAWHPATFDHNTKTSFPLTGGHQAIASQCATCHVNNVYAGLSTLCFSCHQQDMLTKATTPVPHTGFPTDCSGCHTTNTGWTPSTFVHATVFALVGAHAALACTQCHTSTTTWSTTATTCYGCHQQDFTTANSPLHTGFVTDCSTCHTTTAWSPATFDHTKNTSFPLTGAHTTVTPCTACHVNNVYAGLSTACYSCHSPQFTAATTPVPHAGFPTDCSTCHTTNPGWAPSTYSHANATPRFPQDTRHLNAGCAKCHQTPTNYTTTCCTNSGCHNRCTGDD